MTEQLFSKSPWCAHVGVGEDACCFFDFNEASGIYEMKAKRSTVTAERAVLASAPTQRHIMKTHRLMAHPSEHITRMAAKAAGIKLTGEWSHCPECDMTKIRRHAVSKKTTSRVSTRAALLYVDLPGPVPVTSLGGSKYVMIRVDDHSRFKVAKFMKSKDCTTAALESYIADYITPAGQTIGAVRTDNGEEFEGKFQRKIEGLDITHQHTPPDTPQYNGVAERALGLLREKTIALLEDLKKQDTGAHVEGV